MIEHLLVALALHCGRGELYRVHLHKCVPKTSVLARGFEHRPRHRTPPAKECCYVQISIKVSPDEVITDDEIQELARSSPHIWIETDGSTPRFTMTFEQQSKLWRWLTNTMGMHE
jgi:hypothetical protein